MAYPLALDTSSLDDELIHALLPRPNLVIYLSCGHEEVSRRKNSFDYIETGFKNENDSDAFKDFQKLINSKYEYLFSKYNQNLIRLNTDCDIDYTFVISTINKLL